MTALTRYLVVALSIPFPVLGASAGFPHIERALELRSDTVDLPMSYETITVSPEPEQDSVYRWRRPPEVAFVAISGCGGGGGGAAGDERNAEDRAGLGGHAAPVTHTILGHLQADTYLIKIGAGGRGGKAYEDRSEYPPGGGQATTLSGPDANVHLAGAPAVSLGSGLDRDSGQDGTDGPYGDPGGSGGDKYFDGDPALKGCAGGGGSGRNRNNNDDALGGTGAPGRITITPLVSFDFVRAEFKRLETLFERQIQRLKRDLGRRDEGDSGAAH